MTQQTVLIKLLRDAGPAGVSVHDVVYQHGITRAAAIVHDLRDAGWVIDTHEPAGMASAGARRLATYVLRQEPGQPPQPAHNGPGRPQAVPVASTSTLPPATDLRLPCGCVRAASGMAWLARCQRHERDAQRAAASPSKIGS